MLLIDKNRKVLSNSVGIMPEFKKLLPASFVLFLIRFFNYKCKPIFPLGANLFIRNSIFKEINGFDENLFLCFEEPDIVRRMPSIYSVEIFNKKIMHLEGHTTDSIGINKRLGHALTAERFYFKKYNLNYNKYCMYAFIGIFFRYAIKKLSLISDTTKEKFLFDYYYKKLFKPNTKK